MLRTRLNIYSGHITVNIISHTSVNQVSELALTKEKLFRTPVLKNSNFITSAILSSGIKSIDIEPAKKYKILLTDVKRDILKQHLTEM